MTLKEIVTSKNIFQGLKFDRIYFRRNVEILSQINGNLIFETYLYAWDTKNITYKIKVKVILRVPNDNSVQTTYKNQAILDDGICYQDYLDMIPLSSVQSIKNEQFLKIWINKISSWQPFYLMV